MHAIICLFLIVILNLTGVAHADTKGATVFPPVNCVDGQTMYMGWDGIHSTSCNTGQDILSSTLNCTEGQQVVFEGNKYTCKTVAAPSACAANEVLSYNGTRYTCVHTDVPTCGADQVLTFNGSGFVCVNRTDEIPTCAANQFLTYNGSNFQCASTQQVAWPTCAADQMLTSNGSGPICAPLPHSTTNKTSCLYNTYTYYPANNLVFRLVPLGWNDQQMAAANASVVRLGRFSTAYVEHGDVVSLAPQINYDSDNYICSNGTLYKLYTPPPARPE